MEDICTIFSQYNKVLILEYDNLSDTSPNSPGPPTVQVHIHSFDIQI